MFAAEVGRNDPCPCGSGKKYKKCCLAADERAGESPVQRWHDLDGRVAQELARYAQRRFGPAWDEVFDEYPIDMDEHPDAQVHWSLFMNWALYEHKIQGRPVVDWYLEDRGRNLGFDEKGWLEAQRRAWLSMLEVTDVVPGATVTVLDLLTGHEHVVTEVSGSRMLGKHSLVLGRVVEHAGAKLFCGLHPNPLPPLHGPELLGELRKDLRGSKKLDPTELRQGDTATFLINRWQDEVDDLASAPPPKLANTDGEELVWTTDSYAFTPASARTEVEKRLAAEPEVEPPEPGEKDRTYTFFKGAATPEHPATVIGTARLLARELRVESNSTSRADTLRARVETACAGLVRHRRRSTKDMQALLAEAATSKGRGSEPVIGPEADAALLEFKRRHYASWSGEALPALDGLTPREAAATPEFRARLVALIKDMERSEAMSPPGHRFDFAGIRAELGIKF
jgi:hypothetical protein